MLDNHTYFIIGGTYFTPFAPSLVKDMHVDRMMLETMWSVFQNYVTSIPTLFIQNVGIPIGFTFSLEEDIPIYTDFFKDFQSTFGFSISDFIDVVESDQGGGLKSAVEQFGLRHLCCLRHLLVSLGHEEYSYQIGKLISVCTYDEYVRRVGVKSQTKLNCNN